jgi:hypothetical protein
MKTTVEINFSYNQILNLVKQLPFQEKIKLSKELDKEGIENKLNKLLKTFKTNDLSMEDITKETEAVRKKIYESKKK